MPRPKGIPKTGGRAKGVKNKNKEALEDICTRLGVNVFEGILIMTRDADKDRALTALGMAAKYLYPIKRAIEVSGPNGEPIKQESSFSPESKQLLADLHTLLDNLASESKG